MGDVLFRGGPGQARLLDGLAEQLLHHLNRAGDAQQGVANVLALGVESGEPALAGLPFLLQLGELAAQRRQLGLDGNGIGPHITPFAIAARTRSTSSAVRIGFGLEGVMSAGARLTMAPPSIL